MEADRWLPGIPAWPACHLSLEGCTGSCCGAMESPCTKVCVIDPLSGLCQGCRRTLAEIAQWASLTEIERREIMARLPTRDASKPR